MSYRSRENTDATLADMLSKTERLAAVRSIRFVERSRSAAGGTEKDSMAGSHGFIRWLFALAVLSPRLADRRPAYALALRSTINLNNSAMHIKKVPPTPS